MKKLNKIVCFILGFLIIFSSVGCVTPQNNDEKTENPPIVDSKYDFVVNGATDYRILISKDATDTEKYAASELATFFKQATGSVITTVNDSVSVDKDGKFISVGNTKLFNDSGMKVSYDELGEDGFKVLTFGNSVILNAFGENGKLYSVYDFLEEQFNFEVYASDEIYIDSVQNCKLKDFNYTETPDFIGRDVHDVTYAYDSVFAARKRLRGVSTKFPSYLGSGSMWSPALYCDNTFKLLNPDKYMAEHGDWYSSNGKDLCYSTGAEDTPNGQLMRETILESLKAYIEKAPNATYFLIGQEDNCGECSCSKCAQTKKLYGGVNERISGVMMVFINKMARMVKDWLKVAHPERAEVLKIGIFAYQSSKEPPVTKNESTGEYEFHPDVVPEDNVIIRLAPLEAIYSKNLLDDEYNKPVADNIRGWNALGADIYMWIYSCPFGAYLYPTYNWHVMQENYKILLEYGVKDILDQGSRDSSYLVFNQMRDYVQAELMWDVDQDINVLIDDFITHYYKDATPYVKEYFNLINSNYALMERTQDYVWYADAWGSRDNALAKYYPKQYLNQCLEIFERAFNAAEQIDDASTKGIVLNRLNKEELSPRYMMLDLYRSYYDSADLSQMLRSFQDDANNFGLTYYGENWLISKKYETWNKSIE